jgi:hypothetical protein
MTSGFDTKTLVDSYADWLKSSATTRVVDRWTEITVPFLDHANDHFQFYVRLYGDKMSFNDDGYTLNGLTTSGFNMKSSRADRLGELVKQFGATLENGSIAMSAPSDKSADAMNRYVQALIHVDSMIETITHRVIGYFAEDVAQALLQQDLFFTQNVSIIGKSKFQHVFDFLFQQTKTTPTRFGQAPATLDKNSMATILFNWDDARESEKRKDAELIVFGNDKDKPINSEVLAGFDEYNVPVLKYSEIPDKAQLMLSA